MVLVTHFSNGSTAETDLYGNLDQANEFTNKSVAALDASLRKVIDTQGLLDLCFGLHWVAWANWWTMQSLTALRQRKLTPTSTVTRKLRCWTPSLRHCRQHSTLCSKLLFLCRPAAPRRRM